MRSYKEGKNDGRDARLLEHSNNPRAQEMGKKLFASAQRGARHTEYLRGIVDGYMEEITEWRTIESAPKENVILISDGVEVDTAYWDYDCWCAPHSQANSIPYEPTHWAPLPKGPIDQGLI